jgi:hypothetical protein
MIAIKSAFIFTKKSLYHAICVLFAFGRQQSRLPKAVNALFDPLIFIENNSFDTFDEQ